MRVKKAIEIFFILGLFFFPFNQYEGISALGEFRSEAAVVFFIPAFLLILVYSLFTKKIYFPVGNKLYIIVLLLLVWCLFSFIFNFYDINSYFFKQTKGVDRFIRQFFSLILSVVLFSDILVCLKGQNSRRNFISNSKNIYLFFNLSFNIWFC